MTSSTAKVRPFDFECYGVHIRITGNDQEIIDWGESVARKALINDLRLIEGSAKFASVFVLTARPHGEVELTQDGSPEGRGTVRESFAKYFDSLVRVAVAENAVDRLFIHAGAVGWKGKAIVMPGTSFIGKSTLVAEFVRQGADYYSDDYAIFDMEGALYAFPRTLAMRADDENYTPFELTPDELGGVVGTKPIPVGTVLFTEYIRDAEWKPEILTPGQAVLAMVPFTFSFVNRPEFSLGVLNKIAERAIIVSSQRASADIFVKFFLDFVDKNVD
jgi:hypothetical protein